MNSQAERTNLRKSLEKSSTMKGQANSCWSVYFCIVYGSKHM